MKILPIAGFLILFVHSLEGQELQPRVNKEFGNLPDLVGQAAFSPFRNYFAYTVGNNSLRILDRNWEQVFEHAGDPEAGPGYFAFSPDEQFMVYGRYRGEGDMALINLNERKVVQVLSQHSYYITHLEFSKNGDWLVSCAGNEEFILWAMRNESLELVERFTGFESSVNGADFSYDDRFLVTGDSYGNVKIMEQKNGEFRDFQEFKHRRHGVQSVVFSPSDYSMVTGSTNGLRRYRLKGNRFVLTDSLDSQANIVGLLDFSPDGRYLAYGHYRTGVVARIGEDSIYPVEFLYRHQLQERVLGAVFSEDGQYLTSYGTDNQVIVWEVGGVDPSGRSLLASWLGAGLSLSQRRSLTPGAVREIVRSVDKKLTLPRDEFETTPQYRSRRSKLSDWTLMKLQLEMEKHYGVKTSGNEVRIPLQGLIGYNADVEIYKVKFMETEAGVALPVTTARTLKQSWQGAYVQAKKERSGQGKPFIYGEFQLYHPQERAFFPVTPLENPFHLEEEAQIQRSSVQVPDDAENARTETVGRTYALLFATNVYDSFNDLVNPVLDAQTIATELVESYGVISEVVINSTLSETASVIREYASREYEPEDNLLIFFAGHGIYDEVFREGYVISRDSRMDDPGKTSYLSHSNLRTMVNNITCPHIFLVMDVCFGGTFDPRMASMHRGVQTEYSDISTREFVERKLKYRTRLYLTSGGKEYVPDGRPGFHSPFARRFIESLRHYGGDDGVLTTSEILQFVERVDPQPRFGEFGDNEPGSDFILVVR